MSEHATHQFAPRATSPADARRFVRQTLTGWGADAVLDDAVLLTNELVTNAVVHAGTALSVSCALGAGHVQIAVADTHSARTLPATVSNAPDEKTSGRGLYLLSQISTAWGVEYEGAAKRVWFRLSLSTPAQPLASEGAHQPAHFVDLGTSRTPVRVSVVETDPDGLVLHWSAEAEHLLGWPADEVVGRSLQELVTWLPEEDTGSFAELLAMPRWCGEYRMRTAGGEEATVFVSQVHANAGEEARVVSLIVPAEHRAVLMPGSTGSSADRENPAPPVPSRAGLLPLEPLLELAVEHSRELLEGDVAYALLVTDDDLDVELRTITGLEQVPTKVTRWRKPSDLAASQAVRTPVFYADLDRQEIPERFLADAGMKTLVTAPLHVGERVIGRIGVAAREVQALGADDAERLQRSVDRFSLAVESARLNELERVRRGRLSYLAEASDLLAGVLDPDMAAALTAQLVVPRLAEWCAVYLLDPRRTPRLACVWHAREHRIDVLRNLLERLPAPPLEGSGRPQQWPAFRELVTGTPDSLEREVAGGPAVSVSLSARGRPIGSLVAGRSEGQEFRSSALDTLDDLCRRAAWAVDNARLYRDRSAISHALQRSLLPAGLPKVPGVDVGIGYEAAGEAIDVGGDFYDVFEIDGARWGFVIGDVCGKGAEAAAVAGLARHSLRVLARENQDVPGVLRRLNATILAEGEATRFVTLIYGEFRHGTDGGISVTLAAAGHPLPVLVSSNGDVRVVGQPQTLLGVLPDLVFRTDTIDLRPGQHLVCTTDGVTDRRVDRRTLGERGLHGLLRQTAVLPAQAIASRVRQAVLDFGSEPLQDDLAVLVLQPVGTGPGAQRIQQGPRGSA